MKLTANSQQKRQRFNTESAEAGAQRATEKAANPGGSPQKQKAPTKRLGRRRPTGLGPCSNKKSVLGRAGTHFSTSFTLPHSCLSCQERHECGKVNDVEKCVPALPRTLF